MRLALPDVTLCSIASVNLEATTYAIRRAMSLADFGDVILLTDKTQDLGVSGIRIIPIDRISSSQAYSFFMLKRLVEYITTPHCMVVQWDGFPTHSLCWDPNFLEYDYIGAPWPQFSDGHDVGNGGFSLRSRRLMDACLKLDFEPGDPEDVVICRTNRTVLEGLGFRFADASLASRFSRERSGEHGRTFGFHGVFNMIDAIGADEFWRLYKGLDDPTTIWRDLGVITQQLRPHRHFQRRRIRLWKDRIFS